MNCLQIYFFETIWPHVVVLPFLFSSNSLLFPFFLSMIVWLFLGLFITLNCCNPLTHSQPCSSTPQTSPFSLASQPFITLSVSSLFPLSLFTLFVNTCTWSFAISTYISPSFFFLVCFFGSFCSDGSVLEWTSA